MVVVKKCETSGQEADRRVDPEREAKWRSEKRLRNSKGLTRCVQKTLSSDRVLYLCPEVLASREREGRTERKRGIRSGDENGIDFWQTQNRSTSIR